MARKHLVEGVLVAALAAAMASVLTTWTRSGQRDRNGIATLESLDRLDLLEPPWNAALVVVTAALPIFFAVAAVGVALRRPLTTALGALAACVVLGAWAIVVLRSPLRAAPGPQLALTSVFALAVTIGVTTRAQRRQI